MSLPTKTHRWIQLGGFGLLLLLILKGAGADLTRAGYGTGLAPLTNPLIQPSEGLIQRTTPIGLLQMTTPLKEVRVRLFSQKKVRFLSISSPRGIRVNGHRLEGKTTFSVQNGKIHVSHKGRLVRKGGLMRITATRGTDPLMIRLSSKLNRVTRGSIRLTLYKGQILITNQLPLEEYLPGIVESELGSLSVSPEAMKAQMVAGRSYLLAMRRRHQREGYEFCDAPHCQMFTGVVSGQPALESAAESTRGLYLTYNDRPAIAFYHHNCGGATASVQDVWPGRAHPYLTRIKDGQPAWCRKDRYASWVFSPTHDRLQGAFRSLGWIKQREKLQGLSVTQKDSHGRALRVQLHTSTSHTTLEAGAFRRGVNRFFGTEVLRSTRFSVHPESNLFVFQGKGWGHGVGLCQAGAIEMARSGYDFREILAHYYPGTKIERLSN